MVNAALMFSCERQWSRAGSNRRNGICSSKFTRAHFVFVGILKQSGRFVVNGNVKVYQFWEMKSVPPLGWEKESDWGRGDGFTSFLGELFGEGVALEPVAVALDVDHFCVVQQAVEDGRGDDRVFEEFLPVGEALF